MFRYLIALIFSATSLYSQPLTNDNGWRPAWGLDRIDQRDAQLDDRYNYRADGSGVRVYVFDSGINETHEEFEGRVAPGFNSVPDENGTNDCHGHGTHTASLIGGKTYGVAKKVTLVPVRVLNCNASGASSYIYPGVDWIIANHVPGTPGVVSMAIGGTKSIPLNEAVRSMISAGLIVVVAAGNQNKDACLYSPSSEESAIVVGAIDRTEHRASYSNYGTCVDIFAPGSDLVGAWSGASNNYRSTTGTSNAAPIVAGIAALMLQENPSLTHAQIEAMIIDNGTKDALFNIGPGSPNVLAYSINSGPAPIESPTTTVPSTTTTTVPKNSTNQPIGNVIPKKHNVVMIEAAPCQNVTQRARFGGVPYICVNTGSQLLWIPQRYSPSR